MQLQQQLRKRDYEVTTDAYLYSWNFQLKVLRALVRRRIFLLFRGKTVAFLSVVAPFGLIVLSCMLYYPLQHVIVPQHVP